MGKMKKIKRIFVSKNGNIISDFDEAQDILTEIREGKNFLVIDNVRYSVRKYDIRETQGHLYLLKTDNKSIKEKDIYYHLTNLLISKYFDDIEFLKDKIELLSKTGEFFAEVINIEEIIKRIIREIKRVLKVEIVSIFKVDEKDKKISFYEFTKGKKELKSIEIEWGKGIVGYVAIHKTPLIVNDVSKDKRFYPEVDRKTGFKTKNLIAYPLIVQKKIIGVIEVINKRDGLFTNKDLEIISLISSSASVALQNAFLYRELDELFKGTITSLANSVEAKDPYTSGHVNRVTELSVEIGKRIGLKGEDLRTCELAAILHDIGKIAIPDSILKKPDKLTEEEFEIMKTHVYHGARILNPIPGMKSVIPAVLHHHERWDGKGYPMGLKGKEIPLIARIITITDSFDAMNSDRPYRKRLAPEVIEKELREKSGFQFDPELVDVFLEIEEVKELLNK